MQLKFIIYKHKRLKLNEVVNMDTLDYSITTLTIQCKKPILTNILNLKDVFFCIIQDLGNHDDIFQIRV